MRQFDWDLIRGGHYGQRSCEPHLKAEHMAAPTNLQNVKKALANPEPSTHDPQRAPRYWVLKATLLQQRFQVVAPHPETVIEHAELRSWRPLR
jgi:hypothetical protein